MKKSHGTGALALVIALGIAGCGARAGLDPEGPLAVAPDDAGSPPYPDADALAPLDALTPDVGEASMACSDQPPSRSYSLTACGDLGPRIQDTAATDLYRELPCDVPPDAFACGATLLSYADCEAYCLSDSFNLLSLNGSLILSCRVWIYAQGAHELQCDTVYAG